MIDTTHNTGSQGLPREAHSWEDHAELAMKAARSVARARRKGQKEKMGHVVCHHLLCLLNAAEQEGREVPPRRRRHAVGIQAARELENMESDPQISLGF